MKFEIKVALKVGLIQTLHRWSIKPTAFDIKNEKKVFDLFFFRSTAAFNVFFYK